MFTQKGELETALNLTEKGEKTARQMKAPLIKKEELLTLTQMGEDEDGDDDDDK